MAEVTPAQLAQLQRDFDRLRVKVETFTGERGNADKTLSAVRRQELQALASLKLRSKQITAAPTQTDYNALQADVATIFDALARISNRLGNAVIPKV